MVTTGENFSEEKFSPVFSYADNDLISKDFYFFFAGAAILL